MELLVKSILVIGIGLFIAYIVMDVTSTHAIRKQESKAIIINNNRDALQTAIDVGDYMNYPEKDSSVLHIIVGDTMVTVVKYVDSTTTYTVKRVR